VIVATILIGVMMGLGLATASFVDGEQSQSGRERVRESAFNIAESALDGQVFQITRAWPSASAPYPASCTPTSSPTLPCPDAASLQASATTVDYNTGACPAGSPAPVWTTSVRDDGGGAANYYDAQVVNAQPTYDANGNGRMWVRSSGTARCIQRTLITAVTRGERVLNFPRNAVMANWFEVTNNGRKVIINTKGKSAQPADAVARCAPPVPSPCMKFDAAKGQVSPNTANVSPGAPVTALSPDDLAALKARAISLNTYFPAGTCPPSLTGAAVYVEDFTGCSGGSGNSAAQPGSLYIARGTLSLGGNAKYYGLVYMGNLQNSSGVVVSLGGTAAIIGAVVIDGPGGLSAGSSKANVIYDSNVFDVVKGVDGVGLAPNTFRELPRGQ